MKLDRRKFMCIAGAATVVPKIMVEKVEANAIEDAIDEKYLFHAYVRISEKPEDRIGDVYRLAIRTGKDFDPKKIEWYAKGFTDACNRCIVALMKRMYGVKLEPYEKRMLDQA